MNRFLMPLAFAALLAGCSLPAGLGQQSSQPAVADPPQTVVVREVHYTDPVVCHDTVYVPEQAPYQEPVYTGDEYNTYNEYNQYNEYTETNVYVHKDIVVRPYPRQPGWSPRENNPQWRDRQDGSPNDRNQPRNQEQPRVVPQPSVQRVHAPVVSYRQMPVTPVTPPTSVAQPVQQQRQSPVRGGGTPATPAQKQAPKPVPIPPNDGPVTSGSAVAAKPAGTGSSHVASAAQPVVTDPVQVAANGQ
ncbi:MAG TPA: hypothetical protein VMH22_15340 [bacterium]|nr:hypothetical protein [bacterium]